MTTGSANLSAVLVTLDAGQYLDRVLQALRFCDEIAVLDCGSRDDTRAIAEQHGAAWHEHPFDGFGPQKGRAVAAARNDWVLSIDADEVLDEELATAIAALPLHEADPRACWRVRRRTFVGSREIRHGSWNPDRVVRLFNRRHNDFDDLPIHESVSPCGPVQDLPGSLLHYSYEHLADLFRPRYHLLKADRYRGTGRRASGIQLAVRAAWAFGRSFVLKRGFLDGPAGVVVALSMAASESVGLAMASDESAAAPEPERERDKP